MGLEQFNMTPAPLPPEADRLRIEVRRFLQEERDAGSFSPCITGWTVFDRRFSLRFAKQGWIGMTWPRAYGGGERNMLERYVVTEELLASGAPCASHWPADRQVGPLILRFGSEKAKHHYIPRIVRGECSFAIGISEPDAGSDVASIRTRATKVDGGWRITGRKIWTSNAHNAEHVMLLCRTAAATSDDRRAGLSHFILDLPTPGVTLRPVINMLGQHHFNEITFDDAFVEDERLLGDAGDGWAQVATQLSLERAGPERFMSNFPLIMSFIDALGPEPSDAQAAALGRMLSHAWTLRRMVRSIANLVSAGHIPDIEAATSKEMGTRFERENAEAIRTALADSDHVPQGLRNLLHESLLYAPCFTIRGGTTEIMRGIVAKGLGLR